MNNSVSLISKDTSTCIKGILIFLIILGHNMCFTIPLEKWGAMTYLYSFHIQGFFILPFLYGSKLITKDSVIKNVIRLYWPYFILATILMIGYGVYTHFANFTGENIAKLYLCGSEEILRTMCGYAALWFLPAMLFTLILKDIFYQSNMVVKCVLILISALLNINSIFHFHIAFYSFMAEWFDGLVIALRYLLLGITLRWIMTRITDVNSKKTIVISFILFAIGTAIYFTLVIPHAWKSNTPWFKFIAIWMPIVFMIMTCNILELFKDSILKIKGSALKLGELSLPIYLVSPFIGYATYFTLLHFNLVCWETGIIAQFIITTIAFLIAKYKIKGKIKQFLMPRNTTELKSVLGLK